MWDFRHILITIVLASGCGGPPATKKPAVEQALTPLSGQTYAHYLRGQVAQFEGDLHLAIAEFKQAVKHAPTEAPIALALIGALHLGGNRTEAISLAQQAQLKWPTNDQVWIYTGALHRSQHHYKQAGRAFKRAIDLGNHTEDTLLSYAKMLVHQQQPKKAKQVYDKTLKRHPDSIEAHYQLAKIAFTERDNLGPAIGHLETITDLNPYEVKAWALLAACFYRNGQPKLADDSLRSPFDRSEGQFWIANQLFFELLDLEVPKAAGRLDRILDRDDLPIDTRISMAHWYLHLGNFEGALARGSALATATPSGAIAELRALALQALQRDREAQIALENIPIVSPAWPLMQSMLAKLAAKQNDPNKARKIIRDALTTFPDDAALILAQASVEETAKDIPRARALLLAAIENHPKAAPPRYALAQLETRAGRITEAIEAVSPLLEENSQDSNALNYIGYSLIKVPSAHERAQLLLQRALELSPDSAFVLDSYGWFLFQTGAREPAAPFLQRAARLTPAEAEVLWHLAELRWQQGAKTESLRLWHRAETLATTSRLRDSIRARRKRVSAPSPK